MMPHRRRWTSWSDVVEANDWLKEHPVGAFIFGIVFLVMSVATIFGVLWHTPSYRVFFSIVNVSATLWCFKQSMRQRSNDKSSS